jgi:hypothetical protein
VIGCVGSKSGSRDVVSLVIEEALALSIELASPAEAAFGRKGIETADMDEAEEASPVRR